MIDKEFNSLLQSSNVERVQHQRRARQLLFDEFSNLDKSAHSNGAIDPKIAELRRILSDESAVFVPNEVQKEVYANDTGTAMVPRLFKRLLVDIRFSFIVRPVTIEDARRFIAWAYENKVHYTIRGAGTWPFGGCIPLEGARILDLSHLDFVEIDEKEQCITVGPGAIFPNLRKRLKEKGLALRQDVTNPNSGTLCGWIVTGGLGLGAFKYGHVKNSVESLLVITPQGEFKSLRRGDDEFDLFFGSEGQLGLVAGAKVRVKKVEITGKPYAFLMETREAVQDFVRLLTEAKLRPSTIIYFDREFIKLTLDIEKQHLKEAAGRALENNDETRMREYREDLKSLESVGEGNHLLVLNFDTAEDYQAAVKSRMFGAGGETVRFRHLTYQQLPPALAHKFWDHRYKPVQMKQRGPSMLVSETIIPLDNFPSYMQLLRRSLRRLLDIEIKTEAHVVNEHELLIQSILLADTKTFRHKLYFALVPFMTQMAVHFGAKPYGIGVWNLPFLKLLKKHNPDYLEKVTALKEKYDDRCLINRGKFLNAGSQRLMTKFGFSMISLLNSWVVKVFDKSVQEKRPYLRHPIKSVIWKIGTLLFPQVVPSTLKASRHPIAKITSTCAECDSCERVCPTSDVFGLFGPGTPITRRKTANRLVAGETITQEEALGFLVCTRCDNCTRVCPTDIPLTKLFDMVEEDQRFQKALQLNGRQKNDFINRFWQVMKESPLYLDHTLAKQKESRSHLQHGLKIIYDRGFEYGKLFIDPETCIRCGMCAHENACTYGARLGHPRQIPELIDLNCALCNACVNYCPENKAAQEEREFLDRIIHQSVDLEEKRYWADRQNRIHDTTKVLRSTQVTEMSDVYVSEQIIMEIDKEASSGDIPVSGMGQGDRHMGIGFDAERFAHFHIVGPAQNRLHEGDPDEELSVILGKHEDFCTFDKNGKVNAVNGAQRRIKLRTPIMYNVIDQLSNGKIELAMIKVAEKQGTLVTMYTQTLLDYYEYFLREGDYQHLPQVIMPRVDHELLHRLIVNPNTNREFLMDLWSMPAFELEYDPKIERTLQYIRDSVYSQTGKLPLISGYIEVPEQEMIGINTLTTAVKRRINDFLDLDVDMIHIHGLRNKDDYYVTSNAVHALHHYLLRIGMRHELSIIASGGIRLASDSQKTIQRGAEATLIDFAALLALDPTAYRASIENRSTTDKLLSMEVDWAVERLNNQAESRKVQILEVLGASGFKDIKKTVGEKGRLIDFRNIEFRLQRDIFENHDLIDRYHNLNKELIKREPIPRKCIRTYAQLKKMIQPVDAPHDFYRLGDTNQNLYRRDFVWPGDLIASMGRMAAGDTAMLDLKNVKGTGLLGDGFDVMKILYNKDPMDIPESELNTIHTSVRLDKELILECPWMFGGKSVGSIGLDTWKAHVIASRVLGTQYDTGEGGYPTYFFLNEKGEPIFFTENEICEIKQYFESGKNYSIQDIRATLIHNEITSETHPQIFEKLEFYPSRSSFHFMSVIDEAHEPYVSTELKTGLFGVTKETIGKTRRVVIAYSQGAKMGIGGHILAKKVNKLVSYLRGIEGLEELDAEALDSLTQRLHRIKKNRLHPLHVMASDSLEEFERARQTGEITDSFKNHLREILETLHKLHAEGQLDELEFENIKRECHDVLNYVYSSIISPFPFHNCYSIEDVKAFIDMVRMINPNAVVSVKVSPSIDIEFIAAGLARISKDNTDEILKAKFGEIRENYAELSSELAGYAAKYGMKIEVWLDGPRGGTGASPNIIKGQMGMHIEYAIPLIHNRLVKDHLRNEISFFVSGGIRTYEDVIKAIALGADGIIWGTAPLVAIGCDRNRNCHDGCSRGIATSNLTMQKLRDVENNTRQIVNTFVILQMQVIRALAALGLNDIRELRGRFDKLHWIGLKERVDHHTRVNKEIVKEIERDEQIYKRSAAVHPVAQSNCGVAAVNGTLPIPSYILDEALKCMKNRGMDGVGVAKSLCFPDHPDDYAYRIMVKGVLQTDMEEHLRLQWQADRKVFTEDELRRAAREIVIRQRTKLMSHIKAVFLDPYFDYESSEDCNEVREPYKADEDGKELDFRKFGNTQTDPGDIFTFFLRVKPRVLKASIEGIFLRHRNKSQDGNSSKTKSTKAKLRFLDEMFPEVTTDNYEESAKFMQKAEDLFVFYHSRNLTRILYASDVPQEQLEKVTQDVKSSQYNGRQLIDLNHILDHALENPEPYLQLMHDFIRMYPYTANKHRYTNRQLKIAAVMSCGKNFATWKTAGREIPWQTPAAPNNIIHVRLATGSVVDQMNSHPFSSLNTALTHNGETTNYEALKQRVEFFNLSPTATTDTEVAALKFHLIADEWEYPDWAVFESLSPTTGDDLHLIDADKREQLEDVQRVEFASSPDGPYQYLCLRHNPANRTTERVDLKDPADLRPNISAFWVDKNNGSDRAFSIISSEEHAVTTMLRLMDKEGLIDGAVPDSTIVSNGMISRYHFDGDQKIDSYEFIDRYGDPIELEESGSHYSYERETLRTPAPDILSGLDIEQLLKKPNNEFANLFRSWDFNTCRWVLYNLVNATKNRHQFDRLLGLLTWLNDYLRTIDTEGKATGSLLDITRRELDRLFANTGTLDIDGIRHLTISDVWQFTLGPAKDDDTLVIDCQGFLHEGTDPDHVLAAFLRRAYNLGWRRYILYRVSGQRLISTAVMGERDIDDVQIDVYGTPGEYCGAFMQGGVLRVHGNAQNFCGMCMHHGELYVFGNAGKVCGYASKGGKVFIMGNVVDRSWTNSVNDMRCQELEVMVLGSASKFAGESLMGGTFYFGGLRFNAKGQLCTNDRPYLGTKLLGGASRGKMFFFDPHHRLEPFQYSHGKEEAITESEWQLALPKFKEMFQRSNILIANEDGQEYVIADGKKIELVPSNFKLIVPKGGLKGYESH